MQSQIQSGQANLNQGLTDQFVHASENNNQSGWTRSRVDETKSNELPYYDAAIVDDLSAIEKQEGAKVPAQAPFSAPELQTQNGSESERIQQDQSIGKDIPKKSDLAATKEIEFTNNLNKEKDQNKSGLNKVQAEKAIPQGKEKKNNDQQAGKDLKQPGQGSKHKAVDELSHKIADVLLSKHALHVGPNLFVLNKEQTEMPMIPPKPKPRKKGVSQAYITGQLWYAKNLRDKLEMAGQNETEIAGDKCNSVKKSKFCQSQSDVGKTKNLPGDESKGKKPAHADDLKGVEPFEVSKEDQVEAKQRQESH